MYRIQDQKPGDKMSLSLRPLCDRRSASTRRARSATPATLEKADTPAMASSLKKLVLYIDGGALNR